MAHEHTADCTECTQAGAVAAAGVLSALFREAGALVRRFRERRLQRRRAWATYEALRGLDDRTLRDIGYHRTELPSISSTLAKRAS